MNILIMDMIGLRKKYVKSYNRWIKMFEKVIYILVGCNSILLIIIVLKVYEILDRLKKE